MPDSVRRRYEAMARSGEIAADPTQGALADSLDSLAAALARHRKGAGVLQWLRSIGGGETAPLRGLYIWGGVGRGKTLLMDLFFAAVGTSRKRRAHFNEFMLEMHDGIATHRRGGANDRDPIAAMANALAAKIDLLCFDEFAVYDIADAMILGRLFEQLLQRGIVIVATSNVAPDDLYKDGLNRSLFLPFIALLKDRLTVFHLDAPRDYRLVVAGADRRYVTPLGPDANASLSAQFQRLSGVERGRPAELWSKGRALAVPEAADGVARFSFGDLCAQPLSSGDYLKIAEAFPTVILSGVPILSPARRNEAKRLIKLIDILYDKRTRLVVSAEAEPHELWQGADGAEVEAFEFARTASRLIEMRSDAYWNGAATAGAETKEARALAPGPLE